MYIDVLEQKNKNTIADLEKRSKETVDNISLLSNEIVTKKGKKKNKLKTLSLNDDETTNDESM